ncbi:MAG: lamin tail domain-containing protein [Firmicutes bacterium]|nr:lamin tail domain-containing protein [Bacillota bacterium]
MNQKKWILSVVLIFLAFGLFACDKVTTTTTTTESTLISSSETTTTSATVSIQTLLENASNLVIISNADNMIMSFTLPAEVGSATVSWVSANTEYISIASTVTATSENILVYQATVKQPSESVGDVTVVLTGTFTYGEETYQKDFSIRVRGEVGLSTYSTLLDLHNSASINDLVTASGFVYSTYSRGYFIQDASGAFLNIYTTAENTALVHVGDEVRIKGTYAKYHSLYQVTSLTEQIVLNSNNVVTVDKIALSNPADLLDIDPTNKLLNGQTYTITVTPMLLAQGIGENIYLFAGSTRVATVYYGSNSASILALSQFVGQLVTIDVVFYTYYEAGSSSNLEPTVDEIWITFDGLEGDIEAGAMTDAEKLTLATGAIQESYDITSAFTLPTLSFGEYTTVTVSTEISDYLSYAGGVFTVVRPEVDTTGTITITAILNEESETIDIAITMKAVVVVVPGDDIFISEYIEGSSFNKAIEIYNSTDAPIDLSSYTLKTYFNGALTTTATLTLSGTLAPGDVYVIAHPSAAPAILAIADATNGTVVNFNGNDVIELYNGTTLIDAIGQLGNSLDFAINVTLVRFPTITGGNIDPNDVFDPANEWTTYTVDTFSYLGFHTVE